MAGKKLKVFQAPFGFYDSVVAVPSQAAALRAWGSHQNLFAEGIAHRVTDEKTIAAALAHPETPLRRAIGSNNPFELEPSTRPKVPDLPKSKTELKKTKPERKKRPAPDRSKLDAAEAAWETLNDRRREEEAALDHRRQELEAEAAAAQKSYVEARSMAKTEIDTARRAYVKAGGVE
jgi:hypothetical protein